MINSKYKKINDYIINLNEKILGSNDDIYYIANSTLTRNPFASKILSEESTITSVNNRFFFSSFLQYYLKAFVLFSFYILKLLIYKTYRQRKNVNNKILVDTFFIVDKILENSNFQDTYFTGIDKVLKNEEYTYLVKNFYGSALNVKKFYKVIRILNKSDKNIISEFDFINIVDLFRIVLFIVLYPFKIKKVFEQYKNENFVFDYSLIDSINGNEFQSFVRYIVGKKINNNNSFTKVLSWCEYQDIDKAFYKGIKEVQNDIYIYGCQFLVSYDSWLNFSIPKSEEKYALTPDVVLTNGVYYLNHIGLNKKVGVSLRYQHIFNTKVIQRKEEYILVLGSFIKDETVNLIKIVNKFDTSLKVILRLHPTHSFNMYKKYINTEWVLSVNESMSDVMDKSYMVITNGATGTSLESVCMGKSTIIMSNKKGFNSIPLVDYGKGKIWDVAFSKNDVKILYNNLLDYRNSNAEELKEIATWYKGNFFVEPTEENIIKAFELDKG